MSPALKNIPFSPFISLINTFSDFKIDYFYVSKDDNSLETNKKMFFDNIKTFIINRLEREKFLFIIEDFQYIDSDSLELLFFLFNSKELLKNRFMVILTSDYSIKYDSIYIKEILKLDIFYNIELENLTIDESIALINGILNVESKIDDKFYEKIFLYSNGNPLFIKRLLITLIDNKVIEKGKDLKINFDKFYSFDFPNDIYELIINKVNTLDVNTKKFLQIASVFTPTTSFDLNILKEVFNTLYPIDYDSAIDNSIRIGFLERYADTLNFPHLKIKEVFYHSIDDKERFFFHKIIAEFLEKRNENIFNICYHYNNSDDDNKKLEYNKKCYEVSIKNFSLFNASYFLSKIIEIKINLKIIDDIFFKDIIDFAKLSYTAGKLKEAIDYLNTAIDYSLDPVTQINLFIEKANCFYFLNEMSSAISFYNRAFEIADKNNFKIDTAYPYAVMGSFYYFTYQLDKAYFFLNNAIKFIDTANLETKIRIYGIKLAVTLLIGKFEESMESLKILEDFLNYVSNPVLLSLIYHYASVYYVFTRKDVDKGINYSITAEKIAREVDNDLIIYASYAPRAIGYFYKGEYANSLDSIEKGLLLSKKYNIYIGLYIFYSYKINSLLYEGRFKEAYDVSNMIDPNLIPENLCKIFFLRARSVYFYVNSDYDSALNNLNTAIDIAKNNSINTFLNALIVCKNFILNNIGRPIEEKVEYSKDYLVFIKEAELLNDIISKNVTTYKTSPKPLLDSKEVFSLLASINNIYKFSLTTPDILSILDKILGIGGCLYVGLHIKDKDYERYKTNLGIGLSGLPNSILLRVNNSKNYLKINIILKNGVKLTNNIFFPILYKNKNIGFLWVVFDSERDNDYLEKFSILVDSLVFLGINFSLKVETKTDVFEKYSITDREKEIIELVLNGLKNKEIAKRLHISEMTVKIHLHNIFDKMGIRNRVELVKVFRE